MTAKQIVLALVAVVVTSASEAQAATIKFCFYGQGDYTDNGFALPNGTKEDYWQTDEAKNMRGVYAIVRENNASGALIWGGNTGDYYGSGDPGGGCTSTITRTNVNITYYFEVRSWSGKVDGETINVKVLDNGVEWGIINNTTYTHSLGSGTFNITMPAPDDFSRRAFRVYNAAWLTIVRTGRWTGANQTLNIVIDVTTTEGSSFDNANNKVTLSDNGSEKKFIMAHEVGHKYAQDYAGIVDGNCSLNSSSCPASKGSHSMGSQEYQECAFEEGIAHYFSAATWNYQSQDDCVFRYYKNEFGNGMESVDCEWTNTPNFPVKFMESNCNTPYGSRGVELDWLRQFWDTLTNGSNLTFSEVMDWVDAANVMDFPNYFSPYTDLDTEANSWGGQLNTNWDDAKAANGIDWP